MKSVIYGTLFAISAVSLSGCGHIRQILSPDDENTLSGAGTILQAKEQQSGKSSPEKDGKSSVDGFEQLDLDKLLTDYGLNEIKVVAEKYSDDAYQYRRNEMQDRIIASSNQKCGTYIRTLLSSKSQTQAFWTSSSLLLSGAAAVVPGVQAAKYFAAASTASTGILSTFNDAYFNNMAINVIASGIGKKRQGIQEGIAKAQKKPLKDYSVAAAVADALSYHSACNVVAGLEVASVATTKLVPTELGITRD